ncbi:hypothetical protein MACK_002439 [Theileria orientalis]|uniref:J domain-containing protein n=1 Tax=Theileria orientalis TaxID=68886 RepID=A0A976MBM8_THEOR|nr:hypothetical protein MACK_002439 [Theileria orientalis]
MTPNSTAPSSSEVATNSSLKGRTLELDTIVSEYGDLKMQFCDSVMASCIIDQNKYKNCISGTNACNIFDREVSRPVVYHTCDYIRKFCGQNLDDTLNKLYEAGALASTPETTTKIDEKIKELNKLKHQVRTVASYAGAGSHKAIEAKKSTVAPSEVVKKESDNDLEEEEATVSMIDLLSDAVRTLGLSDECEIDFLKVKRSFRRLARSSHPDKNDGMDFGFDSILDAFRTLDYYFNVFLAGKNCHDCFFQSLMGFRSENTTEQEQLNSSDHELSLGSGIRTIQPEVVDVSLNNPSSTGNHRKQSVGHPEPGKVCKIHHMDTHSPRFYSNISKDDCDVLGDIAYIQCRCGQVVFVPPEAAALGIRTFDCDVCSCSYIVSDAS